jgi:hypothetical protein
MMLTSPSRWGEPTETGFTIRFALLAIAVVVVPALIAQLSLPEPFDLVAPVAGALILVAAYLRWPPEALLTLALTVLFYDTVEFYAGGAVKQLDEAAVGLLALVAFIRAAPAWRSWLWWPRDVAVAAVVVAALLSTFVEGVPLRIWFPALVLVGKSIAFLYTVTWTEFRPWEIRGGMRVVLGIGLVVLALGFVEVLLPGPFASVFGLPAFTPRGGLPVVKSIFVHPALLGWFSVFVALFLFAAFLQTRRWLFLVLGLLFTLGMILTARRRVILSLAAGLGAAFVESLRRLRTRAEIFHAWWPVAAGTAVLAIVFMPLFIGLYHLTLERYVPTVVEDPTGQPGDGFGFADSDENPQARIALYFGSLDIARDHLPLGGGLGRYGSWMSRIEYSPLYEEYGLSNIRGLRESNPLYATDTFWPQILGEFGVIGLVGYVGFLASLGWLLWRESGRREDDETIRILRIAAGMVFAQAVFESLASSMFHSPPRVYLLYLVVGVVASMAWRTRARPADETEVTRAEPA